MSWKENDHQKQSLLNVSLAFIIIVVQLHIVPLSCLLQRAKIGCWVSLLIAGKDSGDLLVLPQPLTLLSLSTPPGAEPAVLHSPVCVGGGNNVLPRWNPVTLPIVPYPPTEDHLLRMVLPIHEMGIGPFCHSN